MKSSEALIVGISPFTSQKVARDPISHIVFVPLESGKTRAKRKAQTMCQFTFLS